MGGCGGDFDVIKGRRDFTCIITTCFCCLCCFCSCGGCCQASSPQHCHMIAPRVLPIGRSCGLQRRLSTVACRQESDAQPQPSQQPHPQHHPQLPHPLHLAPCRHVLFLAQHDQCQLAIPSTAQLMQKTLGEQPRRPGVAGCTTRAALKQHHQ